MERKKVAEMSLESRLQRLLDRRRTNSTLRSLTLPTPHQIDFSSNDFLSLSKNTVLKVAYSAEVQRTDHPLGSGGSRLLDGNSVYAEDLEHEIARFHKAEAGLLFNSGFDANAGFFACVPQPGDIIVYDELVHASVHDGMRLGRSTKTLLFRHNSVSDLRRILGEQLKICEELGQSEPNIIVAVEAIYSMDGDVALLKEIVEAVDDVLGCGKGYIVVDEAHSTGVLGSQGRGLVHELGLEDRIFARLHTFGKSLAGNGAIILGSQLLRQYLINYARPLIYTTFLPYPSLALIRASYTILSSGQTIAMQRHLHELTQMLFTSLHEICRNSTPFRRFLQLPNACPRSPIFAIQLQEPKCLARYLQDQGMMVRAVVPPTVPVGTQRVRVCLHASNTTDELGKLLQALEAWCDAQELLQRESTGRNVALQGRL